MDKQNFHVKVKEIAAKNPRLFALESDNRADDEMIKDVERYYDIILPDFYRDFVCHYGGGYFGCVIVYSCDGKGLFYIRDNAIKEWISEKLFLPVVDFETGDFWGFEIKEGVCQDIVSLYSHEEEDVYELGMDFYEALLKYGLQDNG